MSKWLIRKISGSRRRYSLGKDYADTRNSKRPALEELPKQEPMSNSKYSFLDTTLVKRWLYAQVGQDFDQVYSTFLTRIQPKYLDQYRDCIFWYVERNIELRENGEVWGKWDGRFVKLPYSQQSTFYVHPDTNTLERLN